MKSKYLLLGACALSMVACDATKPIKPVAAITQNSTDDQKFAYMLGAQFTGRNFAGLPRQIGCGIDEDATVQGFKETVAFFRDSTAKMQISRDSVSAISRRIITTMRERYAKTRPDTNVTKTLKDEQIKAYSDSLINSLPFTEAPETKYADVTINDGSPEQTKYSYTIGVDFADNFNRIGLQFKTEFDVDYFLLGLRDAAKKIKDTTLTLALPEDSLKAVGARFEEKAKVLREEAMKKQQEEEEKLKQEVAGLRGDTLSNGMPTKVNFDVKVTGISTKAENLQKFKGKPMLMFYFSATCGHCAHAAPQIRDIANDFAAKGLTTVAVASGGNNKSGIRRFMDDANFNDNINVVWDEARQFGELYSDGYVPKVYLVNPDGTYKLYAAFEKEKEDLKKDIEALLGGKNVVWVIEDPKAAADSAKAAAPAPAPAAKAAPAKAAAPAKK